MAVPFNDLVMAPPDIYPEAMWDGERNRFLVPGYLPIGSEHDGFAYRPGVLEIDACEREAYFFDLADYKRRRDRPETIGCVYRIAALSLAGFIAALVVVLDPEAWAARDDSPLFAFAVAALAMAVLLFLLAIWLGTRRDLEIEHATLIYVPDSLLSQLTDLWDHTENWISRRRTEGVEGPSGDTANDDETERPFADAFWKSFIEGLGGELFGNLGGAAAGQAADAALDRNGIARERLANLIRRHAAWRIVRLHERASGRAFVRVELAEWSAGLDFADDRFPAGDPDHAAERQSLGGGPAPTT